MKEWICSLNEYAGLFALMALLVAFFMPIFIYKKQRKDKWLTMKDELDALEDYDKSPFPGNFRDEYVKRSVLRKGVERK